jgi:hypothetical protein
MRVLHFALLTPESPQWGLRNALRYGRRFAVYGRGWGRHGEWLDEGQEAAAYRASWIAIGQNHFADVPRFASDRLFRAAGERLTCRFRHLFGSCILGLSRFVN